MESHGVTSLSVRRRPCPGDVARDLGARRRKLGVGVMMLTVTPPSPRARSKAGRSRRAQHPLAAPAGSPAPRPDGGQRPPPACNRGAPAKASAGTSRCGAGPPATRRRAAARWRSRTEAAEHAGERVGDRRQHEAPHRHLRGSARIEVTRSRIPSLPVFTNSPTASSAPRKPLMSASPMPSPVSFALSA